MTEEKKPEIKTLQEYADEHLPGLEFAEFSADGYLLANLEIETNCGQDCKDLIDKASAFLLKLTEFTPNAISEETIHTAVAIGCQVALFG